MCIRDRDIRYPAVLEPEEGGGFFVRFVDLENAYTDGLTLDEALFNGAEVLSAMLGWMLDENKPIPDPSPAAVSYTHLGSVADSDSAVRLSGCRSGSGRVRSYRAITRPLIFQVGRFGPEVCRIRPDSGGALE